MITSISGNHEDEIAEREHFNKLLKTDLQILSNYFHSIDVDQWNEDAVPQTEEANMQVVLSFDSKQAFLCDILHDPVIIQDARYDNQPRDNGDELEGYYIRRKLYEIYQQRNSKGFIVYERLLWQFFDTTLKSLTLPANQVRLAFHGGERVRLVHFPKLSVAREEFKSSLKLNKYEF